MFVVTRKEADRIYDLPGFTFEINFKQYAGYLNGAKGNYIHYWWVVSINLGNPTHKGSSSRSVQPRTTRSCSGWLEVRNKTNTFFRKNKGNAILGPGCSGYNAFLTENGPFHPNRDGETLFENVFSWNKVQHLRENHFNHCGTGVKRHLCWISSWCWILVPKYDWEPW